MKPPIPYFGGKITIGPVIAGLLPAHSHYVEPYCGSLSVQDVGRGEEGRRGGASPPPGPPHTIAGSTGQGGAWANRTEVLWSNRPLGVQRSLLDALEGAP